MIKVVLVTGASSGIGKAVALHLLASGYRVFGTSRKANHGDIWDGIEMIRIDVAQYVSVQSGIEFMLSKTEGKLFALVNNAGLGLIGPIENTTSEEANEIIQTNVIGILNMCRACIPALRETGGGYIINITSLAGIMGLPFRGIYSASKFAIEGFSETLSQELRSSNIKVCIVEPGDFRTNINTTRRVTAFVDEPIYGKSNRDILSQVNREVEQADTPEAVGISIARILASSHPKLRYKVATPLQRYSVWIKHLLPGRWFERLVMKRYKL